jgi:hypothetical protein
LNGRWIGIVYAGITHEKAFENKNTAKLSAKNVQVVLAQVKEKQYFCSGILKYRQALAVILTRSVTSLELEQDKPAECGGYKKTKLWQKSIIATPVRGLCRRFARMKS